MNICSQASRNGFVSLKVVVVAFLVSVSAVPASASSWISVAGTECSAYNNFMANALERNNVRLSNPATNN